MRTGSDVELIKEHLLSLPDDDSETYLRNHFGEIGLATVHKTIGSDPEKLAAFIEKLSDKIFPNFFNQAIDKPANIKGITLPLMLLESNDEDLQNIFLEKFDEIEEKTFDIEFSNQQYKSLRQMLDALSNADDDLNDVEKEICAKWQGKTSSLKDSLTIENILTATETPRFFVDLVGSTAAFMYIFKKLYDKTHNVAACVAKVREINSGLQQLESTITQDKSRFINNPQIIDQVKDLLESKPPYRLRSGTYEKRKIQVAIAMIYYNDEKGLLALHARRNYFNDPEVFGLQIQIEPYRSKYKTISEFFKNYEPNKQITLQENQLDKTTTNTTSTQSPSIKSRRPSKL